MKTHHAERITAPATPESLAADLLITQQATTDALCALALALADATGQGPRMGDRLAALADEADRAGAAASAGLIGEMVAALRGHAATPDEARLRSDSIAP